MLNWQVDFCLFSQSRKNEIEKYTVHAHKLSLCIFYYSITINRNLDQITLLHRRVINMQNENMAQVKKHQIHSNLYLRRQATFFLFGLRKMKHKFGKNISEGMSWDWHASPNKNSDWNDAVSRLTLRWAMFGVYAEMNVLDKLVGYCVKIHLLSFDRIHACITSRSK